MWSTLECLPFNYTIVQMKGGIQLFVAFFTEVYSHQSDDIFCKDMLCEEATVINII